jgi:hypothetical protein
MFFNMLGAIRRPRLPNMELTAGHETFGPFRSSTSAAAVQYGGAHPRIYYRRSRSIEPRARRMRPTDTPSLYARCLPFGGYLQAFRRIPSFFHDMDDALATTSRHPASWPETSTIDRASRDAHRRELSRDTGCYSMHAELDVRPRVHAQLTLQQMSIAITQSTV